MITANEARLLNTASEEHKAQDDTNEADTNKMLVYIDTEIKISARSGQIGLIMINYGPILEALNIDNIKTINFDVIKSSLRENGFVIYTYHENNVAEFRISW